MTHSIVSEPGSDLTAPAYKIEPQRKAAEPVPLRETFRLPNARPEPEPQARVPISGAVLPNRKGDAKGEHEKECPRCSALNALVSTECVRCGIVFDRVIDVRIEDELALGGSREMAALWDHVMEDYEDLVRHERFVAASTETNALAYASKKYGHILIASPQDPIARNMRNRIVGLVSAQAENGLSSAEVELDGDLHGLDVDGVGIDDAADSQSRGNRNCNAGSIDRCSDRSHSTYLNRRSATPTREQAPASRAKRSRIHSR
jgi:hypothetical protein